MRVTPAILAALLSCACCVRSALSQTPDPAARLKAMMDETALDSDGAGAWHWKMDVTVYDFNGKHPKPGSIEVWRAGPDMISVLSLDGTQIRTLRVGNKLYRSGGDAEKVSILEATLIEMLNPIPSTLLDPSVKLTLSHHKAGKVKVDCIEPTFDIPSTNLLEGGARLDFCGAAGTNDLVEIHQANNAVITIGHAGSFNSKQIPLEFRISSSWHLRVEGKTSLFAQFSPVPAQFAVTPDVHLLQLPLMTRNGSDFLMLIHASPGVPSHPLRNVAGRVKFDVVFGTDGKITWHNMVEESENREFNANSEASLRRIIIRPYLVNGLRVPVRMSISMGYMTDPSSSAPRP